MIISDYIGQKLQYDIRREYLIRGPLKPQPGFKFPETIIAWHPRRCQVKWFATYISQARVQRKRCISVFVCIATCLETATRD